MKKIFSLCSLVVLLLHSNLFAQNDDDNEKIKKYEFSQSKKVNKTFSVSSSDRLSIDNRFGKVEIHTWNKNEIKVDIDITAYAPTQDWANKVLNDIDVPDVKNAIGIEFRTLFAEDLDRKENRKNDRMKKYQGTNSRQSMEVNYQVYMPASNPLKIENQFGPITVPDFRGEVDLTSKFGSLHTGNLANVKKILVEFGKGYFDNLSNSTVTMKFSEGEFGKLSGNMKLDFEFCKPTKVSFDNNLSGLQLNASYSTVNLRPVGDPAASYSIGTSFGSFKNKTNIKFDSDEPGENDKPKFDLSYRGRSGNGNIEIKANTNFGKIILGEATAEEMKDKDKDKNKHKNRQTI